MEASFRGTHVDKTDIPPFVSTEISLEKDSYNFCDNITLNIDTTFKTSH
jgi:hypothetical protein